MDLADELMQIERRLADGRGDVYSEVLAEDAVVIVPGAVLDKAECVAAMDASTGWDSVALEAPRLIENGDVASLVYRFRGVRGQQRYTATLSSTYRLRSRELVLHQQTPDS
ncbi:nuclear transport factor 2 family protein [Protaetiibacter mangrovi]|uniref:Nuclear transport factor 2 family protein n=1 Tax=Protaetiibacter mangrovi TaxID=2970926 RepID=A0ABT1ZE25_9MICO|nr:nuclear transport factor 2 family protein [Protaetiibacter mangrovi]MCS0498963.1 nuclear transport factor 2 family protein [Protaetiibacter mangrovi]